MTYSPPIPASDLMVDLSESALLAALKVQLEGLALLFGGAPPKKGPSDLAQYDADTEAAFDNLPV
jgi:hypothetical protein